MFWAAYLLQIKSEIANKKFILGSQRCHKLCSLSLCPDMRCGKEWRHTTWHKAEYDVCCAAGNCSVVVVVVTAVVLDHPCLWFMLHHPLTLSNQLVLAPPFPSNINPRWYRVNLDLIWIKEEGGQHCASDYEGLIQYLSQLLEACDGDMIRP